MIKNDPLTERIIASAYRVHSELGSGFNENIYHNALRLALTETDLSYETEKQYKVTYQNKQVGMLKIDLIVNDKVVVEVKAVSGIMPKIFEAQIISYLKITGYKVGLLINFGNNSCQVRRLVLKSL